MAYGPPVEILPEFEFVKFVIVPILEIPLAYESDVEIVPEFVISAQKEFLINKKFKLIIINKNINDNTAFSTFLLNIIKYFSFIYDEINIVSDFNVEFLKNQFEYDNTIIFKSTIINELLDYKSRVIIDDNEYNENDIYSLFNITKNELEKII